MRILSLWPASGLLVSFGALALAVPSVRLSTEVTSEPVANPLPVLTHIRPNIPVQPLAAYVRVGSDFVVGTVRSKTVIPDDPGSLSTAYGLDVEASLFGHNSGRLRVLVGGGELDGRRVIVDGAPVFEIGDRVGVFLTSADEAGHLGVLGLDHGAYRSEANVDGGTRLHGLHAEGGVALEEFLAELHDLAAVETLHGAPLGGEVQQ